MPRVSIITAYYKGAAFIEQTIRAVQAQTFTDWEHVIVDDGSPDDVGPLVARHAARDPRVRLIRQANGGVNRARNAGVQAASAGSEFLYFLDQDDLPRPTMLATMLEQLARNPGAGMAFCNFVPIDEEGRSVPSNQLGRSDWAHYVPTRFWVRRLPPSDALLSFMTVFAYWPGFVPSVSVIRRSAWQGAWDPEIGQMAEDWDAFAHVALISGAYFVQEPLVAWRTHPAQASQRADVVGQEMRLFRKWLSRTDLTPGQRALVRQAWRFRRYRVLPHVSSTWALDNLRRGQVLEGLRCWLRLGRRLWMDTWSL
jgi:glycosyltransferase involved in cell wall biosynthesis